MKWSRLIQPRNPLFWLTLALNALSVALVWIVQNRPLNTPAMLLIASMALGNALLGSWLMWRLLRDEPGQNKN